MALKPFLKLHLPNRHHVATNAAGTAFDSGVVNCDHVKSNKPLAFW